MTRRKATLLVAALALVLTLTLAGALISKTIYRNTHVFLGEDVYDKAAEYIDLRGEKIALSYYQELQKALPNCRIDWDIPFQGQYLSRDLETLSLKELSPEDQVLLAYFPKLTTLDMTEADPEAAYAAAQELPQYLVTYQVPLCGEPYPWDTQSLTLVGADDGDVASLAFLPKLQSLRLENPTADPAAVLALQDRAEVSVLVEVHGLTVETGDTEVDFSDVPLSDTLEIGKKLAYLPSVERVLLHNCGIENEALAAFREKHREEYKVVWTVELGSLTAPTDAVTFMPYREGAAYFNDRDGANLKYLEDLVVIDIGHMPVKNVEFVRYMPHLKYLILAHTTVLDITPLSSCKELVFLELDWTGIKDYTPLLGCTALEDLNLGKTYGDPAPILQMTWLKNLWWVGRGYRVQKEAEEYLPNTNLNFTASYTVGGGWRKLENYYAMRDLLGMEYMK